MDKRTQKRRLTKLADYLDTVPPEHFDMASWFAAHTDDGIGVVVAPAHRDDYSEEDYRIFDTPEEAVADCGTAACVAGHAAALFKLRKNHLNRFFYDWGDVAGEHLGLEYATQERLFVPQNVDDPSRTPKLAAKAVRHLRDHGEVPEWWLANYSVEEREALSNKPAA